MAVSETLEEWLAGQSARIESLQSRLTELAAVGPENGGDGEWKKAAFIEGYLDGLGVPATRYDCPDPRVSSGARPNLVAKLGERRDRPRLWLFAHTDVVPPGDGTAWKSDPFAVRKNGDLLIGRGVEDNQQAIVSMLLLAEGLKVFDRNGDANLGLVFMADEESGSHFGLEWLLEKNDDIFKPEDYYIVPDGGSPNGELVEIAEKAQLWLKFTVTGKQCHASTPGEGRNALVAGSRLILDLLKASTKFSLTNPLFTPPISTFVPTLREANVPAPNILPGKDVFYMDCRLLPGCDSRGVLKEFDAVAKAIGPDFTAQMDVAQWQPATFAPPNTEIIAKLARAVQAVYGVKIKPVGVGGATVASFLRRKGFPAVVWSCIRNTCHQPNETSSITATWKDALVFGKIALDV